MKPISTSEAAPLDQVTAFINAMFEPHDIVEIRRLPKRAYRSVSRWYEAADVPAAMPALLNDNADHLNVYVGANPRDGRVRTNGGVSLSRAFMLDFDHCCDVDTVRAKLASVVVEHEGERMSLPPPTALIASGHGFWPWWRLAEEVRDVYLRTVAMETLANLAGSDPSVSDPARIARLPGFTNWKEPVAPARLVEVTPGLAYGDGSVFDLLLAQAGARAARDAEERARRSDEITAAARARMESRRPGEASGDKDAANVIDKFNAGHDVRTVLESHGYVFAPDSDSFVRPGSANDSNGFVTTCEDGRRRSVHFSTNDPLNDRRFGKQVRCGVCDAFDVFLKLVHGGDHSAAVRDAALLMGVAHKAAPDAEVLDRIVDSPEAEMLRVAIWETAGVEECVRMVREAVGRHSGFDKQVDRLTARLLAMASASAMTRSGGGR